MIRGTLKLAPLVNNQGKRGASTLTNISMQLNQAVRKGLTTLMAPETRPILRELAPPSPAEIPQAIRDGMRLFKGNWKNVTVREAWLNTLVTTEVICWFFVGEVIGKGTMIGYQV